MDKNELMTYDDFMTLKSETYEFEHVSGTDTSGSRQPRADKGRASGHLMLWFQSTEGMGNFASRNSYGYVKTVPGPKL